MSDSPSAPTPVDPYAQANAQLGLSEGTAQFNAALNRTNQVNPLGSSTFSASYPGQQTGFGGTAIDPSTGQPVGSQWNLTGPSGFGGLPNSGLPGIGGGPSLQAGGQITHSGNGTPLNYPPGYSPSGGAQPTSSINIPGVGNVQIPTSLLGGMTGANTQADPYGGSPIYTQNTQLAPQFNAALQKPVDTSQIIGAPGGGGVYQGNQAIQNALYNQQTAYLDPQFAQSDDQLKSQLAGQGIMPGSTAYQNAMDQQNRNKTFSYNQAANSAITGATGQEAQLQGMGIAGENANIAARNAPINEYESLLGQGGGSATAQTPDISGAFGQQYQGALAGYNANVASNNATTSDVTGLVAAGLLYF